MGVTYTVGTGAALWEDGVVKNLNDVIDAGDPLKGTIFLTAALDINNHGVIVANGSSGSSYRGYLLTPVCKRSHC